MFLKGNYKKQDRDISGNEIYIVGQDRSFLSEDQHTLIEYFESKTGGKRLPSRADLDPSEITALLPYVSMFNLIYDENEQIKDMTVRLLGTALVEFYGEWTGKTLNGETGEESLVKVFPATFNRVFSLGIEAVTKKCPVVMYSQQMSEDRPQLYINSMVIPFSDNGEDINILFGFAELNFSKTEAKIYKI